jgi:hypothetical protein
MRHRRWVSLLVTLLAAAGTAGAEPAKGVAGLPARVTLSSCRR